MAISDLTSATNSAGSGTAITVTAPSGIASGDVAIFVINHNSETATVADNNGSTPTTELIEAVYGGAGGGGLAVYRRVCGGSEPSSYAFTMSNSNRWTIVAFKVRGVDNTTPIDTGALADGNDESSTAPTCPGVTTVTDLAWAIAVAGTDGTGNGTFSAVPGTFTEIATINTNQPVSVAYKEISPAGATGNQDFTTTGGNNGTLTIFALRPAAAVSSTFLPRMTLMGCG